MMYSACPLRIRLAVIDARQVASSARVILGGPDTAHADSADAYSIAHDSSAAVAAGRAPPPVAAARIDVMTWSVRLDRCSTAGRCHGQRTTDTPPRAVDANSIADLVHRSTETLD